MAFSYSVMLDLSGRNVLVIGGGKVATRKIHRVLKAGACVTVIAPELCEDISKLLQRHALQYEQRAFQLDDIGAYAPFLVFAATNDSGLNKRIAEYCNENNILVNSITEPKNGNFSVQSEIEKKYYAVSVSTFGQGPGFSKAMREYLEPMLDERLDLAVEVYIGIRQWLFSMLGDTDLRVAHLRRISLEHICSMIDEGTTDYNELFERVKEWLSCSLD